jgi:3-isopropylmalate/(R)-2-methylmalate dehydratase small subunit
MSGSSEIRSVAGRAVAVRGNDIDTDRIIPARFMKTVSFESLGRWVFHDARRDAAGNPTGHPFDDPGHAGARILVANRNFGCGSSREHAPQALAAWGIRAVVAESLAEIFAGNCTAIGIPAVEVDAGAAEALMRLVEAEPGAEVRLDLQSMQVEAEGVSHPVRMPAPRRSMFLSGSWDTVGELLGARDQIAATAARLPYIARFPYPPRDLRL